MITEPDIGELIIRLELACEAMQNEISNQCHNDIEGCQADVEQKMDKIRKNFFYSFKKYNRVETLESIVALYKLKCITDYKNKEK